MGPFVPTVFEANPRRVSRVLPQPRPLPQVPFPLELELQPFCGGADAPRSFAELHAAPPPRASRYRLYAVVEHAGSFHGGHYTAYVRDGDLNADEWNHFSDTHVSRASVEQVLAAQAFLLFYARC